MALKMMYREVACCRYCLEEMRSRGEKVLAGEIIGEGECDMCGYVDEVVGCMWEVQ